MRRVSIKNTLSGEQVALEPDREVGIYACGPTVYSRIHIGNARPFVIFSLLARFLREEGYRVRLVINVTDVNDKIYTAARAAAAGEDTAGAATEATAEAAAGAAGGSARYAAEMTAAYVADTDRLGLGRPDAEPLATESIDAIVAMIEALIGSGHAYRSGDDVYYRVAGFEGYGKLSNRRPEDMDQGEEAGTAELKESPLDFALWKAHKPDEDTSWDSPWGPGRPGWHIECSAMAAAELGPEFAIHGGGSDLVFPHHENEIAQSEAAHGVAPARVWMHNGMIETDSAKMSKSEGNIFQLSEALDRYGPEAVLAYLTSGHYRQPLAFGPEALEAAVARVARFRNFFAARDLDPAAKDAGDPAADSGDPRAGDPAAGDAVAARADEEFRAALADDFNTPRAWAAAADLLAAANRGEAPRAGAVLVEMLRSLGLESVAARAGGGVGPDAEAEELLRERELARAAREFARADALRDELAARGWEVRDSADGAHLVPGAG